MKIREKSYTYEERSRCHILSISLILSIFVSLSLSDSLYLFDSLSLSNLLFLSDSLSFF